jgi:hypothetical protein
MHFFESLIKYFELIGTAKAAEALAREGMHTDAQRLMRQRLLKY